MVLLENEFRRQMSQKNLGQEICKIKWNVRLIFPLS